MQTDTQTIEKYHTPDAGRAAAAPIVFDPRRDYQLAMLNSFREFAGFFREIAETAFAAGMVPQGIRNIEGALVVIWRGAEVGLLPQQSLQSMYLVNGIPHLYGDAPKAIVESSGLLEDCKEYEEGEYPTDDYKWVCEAKRRGHSVARRQTFSIADAKTAKLWGKTSEKGVASPWVLYPKRMLMWRARGYALRDEFPDVLKGLPIRELMDDEDAAFAAARPIAAKVVEPNIPVAEIPGDPNSPMRPKFPVESTEPKPRRGRPPRAAEEPPQSSAGASAPETKAETPAPVPEPPKPEPRAAESGKGSVFDFTKKPESKPEPKPEPPKRVGPHQEAAAKLAAAGFAHKDFIFLLAYAGLLGPKVGEAEIESGAVKFEDLPEKAVKEALADWADVLKALQQKPWEHAHDDK